MQKYRKKSIRINGRRLTALLADTPTKRMIGLMFRKRLDRSECMLFIFNNSGFHRIWMRNMLFPIDVVWLDEHCKVVDMALSLNPCTKILNCREYGPRMPARYVIELAKGEAKRNRIKRGLEITVP